MKKLRIFAGAMALALVASGAAAQINPGASPLSVVKGGTGSTTASGARTNLGLTIGSAVQAWDADLDALAALSGTNTIYYRSGAGAWSAISIGSFLSFSAGTLNVGDAELTALAGLTSANNKCFYWTGSGTAATYDCSSFGRSVANAADAAALRTLAGTVIGTDVQAFDAELSALAGLTSANNKCFYWTGAATAATFDCSSFGRSVANAADAAALRTLAAAAPAASPTFTGTAEIQQAIALSGHISPSQLVANTNDWTPTGFSTASTVRFSTDASRNITGLAGGANGRIVILHNVGAQNAVLINNSASSAAGNKFFIGSDITLSADTSITLRFDATSNGWRAITTPGSGGGGGGSVTSVTIAGSGGVSAAGTCTITTSGTCTVTGFVAHPQGRMTLQSATPVMTSTQSAKTTLFYTAYMGNQVPLYDGTGMVPTVITGGEISAATTDTTKSPAAVGPFEVHDWFVWSDSGTVRVGRGPVWSKTSTITVTIATPAVVTWTGHALPEGAPVIFTNSGGALPTGITAGTVYFVAKSPATNTFNIATSLANVAAGTLVATSGSQSGTHTGENRTTARASGGALTMVNGINLNSSSITNGAAASRGTWVGTTYSNGSSQLDWILGGSASGGTAGFFGVWNAYNRVSTATKSVDSGSYTYSTSTVRSARGGVGMQMTQVVGAVENSIIAGYSSRGDTTGALFAIVTQGLCFNASSAFAGQPGQVVAQTANIASIGGGEWENLQPQLGPNFATACEQGDGTNANTFNASARATFTASVWH